MRHADVCSCRDCGVERLTQIMERMPESDSEGRLAVAFAGLAVGNESLNTDLVALPYPEVLAVADRLQARIEALLTLVEERTDEPVDGPIHDAIIALEEELLPLRNAWRRS